MKNNDLLPGFTISYKNETQLIQLLFSTSLFQMFVGQKDMTYTDVAAWYIPWRQIF